MKIAMYHIERTGGQSTITAMEKIGFPVEASYEPAWQRELAPDILTLTQLREPVARCMSHYRALHAGAPDEAWDAVMPRPANWMEYVKFAPKVFLCRQINMFSRSGDLEEAWEALHRVNWVVILESYPKSLSRIGDRLKTYPPNLWRAPSPNAILKEENLMADQAAMDILKGRLTDELEFYRRAKQRFG